MCVFLIKFGFAQNDEFRFGFVQNVVLALKFNLKIVNKYLKTNLKTI